MWRLQYSQLRELSVGPISYSEDENGRLLPLVICKSLYKKRSLDPSKQAVEIDTELERGETSARRRTRLEMLCFDLKVSLSLSLSVGFFQFVCHSIQSLSNSGKCRIHPFLIWIFTGMQQPSRLLLEAAAKTRCLHAAVALMFPSKPHQQSKYHFQAYRSHCNVPAEWNQSADCAITGAARLLHFQHHGTF